MAKDLDEFLAWLLGRRRQVDLPGGGRSFRRRCVPLWQLWPFSPIIDEVHDVIFVDGIHLGRNAVVLIAQTPDCVLGWYAARSENSRAWGALMSRIAPPALVVTDGAAGLRGRARRSGRPRAFNAVPSMRVVVSAKPPAPSPAGATQSASTNSTTPPPTTTPGTNPSNTKYPITRHCQGPLKIAGVEVRSSSGTSTSTRNPRPTPGHPHSTR